MSPNPLNSIRIVMIETSHPGNIGAAARAMRVMGLYNLTLVKPRKFPSQEAVALASGALDLLDNASVVSSLEEAIGDCEYIFGTSARARHIGKPEIPLDQAAKEIAALSIAQPESKIALLFGTERTGLTNDEVDHCQELIYIPTENNYNSLNIASAIQLVAYELRQALITAPPQQSSSWEMRQKPASQKIREGFFNHLEETLTELQFLNPQNPKHLMRKLRLLYKRADLTEEEINILRGILTETQRRIR